MKYYLMAKKSRANGTKLTQMSHPFLELKTGALFPKDFEKPLVCTVFGLVTDCVLQTLYISPAIIGTKQFYQDLLDCGVDNIEVKPIVMNDRQHDIVINDYLLLNIIGRVPCAKMDSSEYGNIGENMNVMNKVVLERSKVKDLNLFLLDEDTDCIIVNEKVYNHIMSKGYNDIYFEELDLV